MKEKKIEILKSTHSLRYNLPADKSEMFSKYGGFGVLYMDNSLSEMSELNAGTIPFFKSAKFSNDLDKKNHVTKSNQNKSNTGTNFDFADVSYTLNIDTLNSLCSALSYFQSSIQTDGLGDIVCLDTRPERKHAEIKLSLCRFDLYTHDEKKSFIPILEACTLMSIQPCLESFEKIFEMVFIFQNLWNETTP